MFKDFSHKKAQKTLIAAHFAAFRALFEIRREIDVDFRGIVRRRYQE